MSMIRKGLVVVLLVVVLIFALGLTIGADYLFGRALQSGAESALGAPVTIEDSELSLLGGSAAVTGFRGGSAEHPLLDFSEARFDVGVGAALDGRAHLEQATLQGLTIHLVVDEEGKLGWDPGPPPPEAPKAEDPPQPKPDAKPQPPAEEQDLTQILWAYWLRYQEYKPYYDAHGGFFGGGDDEQEEAEAQRARWPGKPEAVTAAQRVDAAAADARGVFWIDEASIENFSWNTLDKRTGKPLLPALASCSVRMLAIGTPPDGSTPASELSGEAALQTGGDLKFAWKRSRDGSPSGLTLAATGLAAEELLPLAGTAFPYDLLGGTLDFGTEDLAFAKDHLSGTIRLQLKGGKLGARADSPDVLGVDAKEFCSLLNAALGQQPVAFLIELGGSPAAPTFKLRNETDLGDMLGGAIKAEVERRANEFIDEQRTELENRIDAEKAELEKRAEQEKNDLKEKAEKEIGNRLGGLLGGKKKD